MVNWRQLRVTTGDTEELNVSLANAVNGGITEAWLENTFWEDTELDEAGAIFGMHKLYICTPEEALRLAAGEDAYDLQLWDAPHCEVDWDGFREAFRAGRERHRHQVQFRGAAE